MLAALFALALAAPAPKTPAVCAECLKAHVAHLAGPELNGRRCATSDEARAADYLVGELKKAGVSGGLPGGGYLQTVPLDRTDLAGPPTLRIGAAAPLVFGRDFYMQTSQPIEGPFVRLTTTDFKPETIAGAVVFLDVFKSDADVYAALRKAGVKALITLPPPLPLLDKTPPTPHGGGLALHGETPRARRGVQTVLVLSQEGIAALRAAPAGVTARFTADLAPPTPAATHNVVGVIHGSAADADHRAVLLSAHYDHLGQRDGQLFPGANDDASGTAAVLEFARVLRAGPKPRRTVYFALFGCEEEGGFGATYFDRNPPEPVADFAANIEFEMIGFRDPKHPDKLMMTGYERSNLGPTLAAHGAAIEQDPYPEQGFFQRSDNYALARVGVVAHTISAWPIPPTYHRPTDTVESLDYPFMSGAAASLVEPIRWLLDSDFQPAWSPGGRP